MRTLHRSCSLFVRANVESTPEVELVLCRHSTYALLADMATVVWWTVPGRRQQRENRIDVMSSSSDDRFSYFFFSVKLTILIPPFTDLMWRFYLLYFGSLRYWGKLSTRLRVYHDGHVFHFRLFGLMVFSCAWNQYVFLPDHP